MKRLLLALLAAIALPTDVSAETWHLLGSIWSRRNGIKQSNSWTVPFKEKNDCEEAGKKFVNKNWHDNAWNDFYTKKASEDEKNMVLRDNICLKGK